jgi:hypothetical protein
VVDTGRVSRCALRPSGFDDVSLIRFLNRARSGRGAADRATRCVADMGSAAADAIGPRGVGDVAGQLRGCSVLGCGPGPVVTGTGSFRARTWWQALTCRWAVGPRRWSHRAPSAHRAKWRPSRRRFPMGWPVHRRSAGGAADHLHDERVSAVDGGTVSMWGECPVDAPRPCRGRAARVEGRRKT